MPYIAKYSANNGPVQYVDSNNNVNFVGYANSAENLTSAFYIRSTINVLSDGYDNRLLPSQSYYDDVSCYGALFVSLSEPASSLSSSIVSSYITLQEYVDVLWYEDTETDFSYNYYEQLYHFTKFNNEIPSALANGKVATSACSACIASDFYSNTGKKGILFRPPNNARAGYFVCVKKQDFDPTNIMFNTTIKNDTRLKELMKYNRLVAYDMTYKCNSNTELRSYARNSYMSIDCSNYDSVQNVKITYDTIPSSQPIYRDSIVDLLISPISSTNNDNLTALEICPTRKLKNIDLISNLYDITARSAFRTPDIILNGTYMYNEYSNIDVVNGVSALLGNYLHGHTETENVHIKSLNNTTCSSTFNKNTFDKVVNNCSGLNTDFQHIADNCLIYKSVLDDGATVDKECNVNYKLLDSSAVFNNASEYAISAQNRINFKNDIINSCITATQNTRNIHDNVLHLHFSAANYENVKVDLSGQKYTVGGDPTIYNNPDSFEITLPASAQTAFSFSSNDVPYTITTY